MIEIEIRVVLKNLEEIKKKISTKFPLIKEKRQIDEYFSHPAKNFYANPALREYLRIRKEKEKTRFEYHKAHITNGKKRHTEEFELDISSPDEMKQILLELGFRPLVTVNKKRAVFDAKDFEICLDSIEGLGDFMEIEAKKDFGGMEKTKQKCIEFAKNLNPEYLPAPEKGYPDMLIEKVIQNK